MDLLFIMKGLKFLFILISLFGVLYSDVVVSTGSVVVRVSSLCVDMSYFSEPGVQEGETCFAWGAAYYHTYMHRRKGYKGEDFSSAFIVVLGNKGDPKTTGLSMFDVVLVLSNYGACTTKHLPHNSFRWPSKEAFLEAMRYRININDVYNVVWYSEPLSDGRRKQPLTQAEIDNLKDTLYKLQHPIIISLPVWKELYKMDTTNYQWSTMDVKGSTVGWHCFLLVDLFKRII